MSQAILTPTPANEDLPVDVLKAKRLLAKWTDEFDEYGQLKVHPLDLLDKTTHAVFKVVGSSPAHLEHFDNNDRKKIRVLATHPGVPLSDPKEDLAV